MIYYAVFALIIGIAYLLGFHNLWAVFKREVGYYFSSPIVYIVGAVMLIFSGIFFAVLIYGLNQYGGIPDTAWPYGGMAVLIVLITPPLTMRLLASEVRQGTLELLLTAPVRDWEVVVGKFLASWLIMSILLDLTLPFPFLLAWRGNPDQGIIIGSYIVLWLLSGALMAIGLLASSLTQHQILAFFISLGINFLLFWAMLPANLFQEGTFMYSLLDQISLGGHYNSMLQYGTLAITDIAYFLAWTIGALFLATQALGMRRWRS
jgi:ABC-2 type transport system permease protein